MTVKPVPDDYPRLSPYLAVEGAKDAIAFYCDVLGFAVRGGIMEAPDGKVGHAELGLGGSVLMVADEWPEAGARSPRSVGGTPVMLRAYVEDVDATYAAAVAAGATSLTEPTDQFYGDRSASFLDPWGHHWDIATHVEDVEEAEMARRAAAAMGG